MKNCPLRDALMLLKDGTNVAAQSQMRRTGSFICFGLGASAAILFYLPQ